MDDRPLECSECRKMATISLVQISLNYCCKYRVCAQCPLLIQNNLIIPSTVGTSTSAKDHGICCGNCSTTMESIQRGCAVGCSECYEIFTDVIVAQILKKPLTSAIHCGKNIKEAAKINSTLRLYALNEALQENLSREEYEAAAQIRDEIQQIINLPMLSGKNSAVKNKATDKKLSKKITGTASNSCIVNDLPPILPPVDE